MIEIDNVIPRSHKLWMLILKNLNPLVLEILLQLKNSLNFK